jgi:hypothetical protein
VHAQSRSVARDGLAGHVHVVATSPAACPASRACRFLTQA